MLLIYLDFLNYTMPINSFKINGLGVNLLQAYRELGNAQLGNWKILIYQSTNKIN
jgi:hypothetical protein